MHLSQGMRYRPGVDDVIAARAGSETDGMSRLMGESIALRFRWRAASFIYTLQEQRTDKLAAAAPPGPGRTSPLEWERKVDVILHERMPQSGVTSGPEGHHRT